MQSLLMEGLGKGLDQFLFYVEIHSMDLLSSCPQLRKGETIQIIQPKNCKKILKNINIANYNVDTGVRLDQSESG